MSYDKTKLHRAISRLQSKLVKLEWRRVKLINHAAFGQQWAMTYNRIELDVTSRSERNANKSSQIATIDFARACVCLQSFQQMQKAHHYCQSIIIQTFKNLCMINCHYNTIRKKTLKNRRNI